MFLRLQASGFTDGKRHMTGPIMVEIDGDQAPALSYYWVAEIEAAPRVYATGTYRDELRKVDGRWRIVHRTQTLDPSAAHNQ